MQQYNSRSEIRSRLEEDVRRFQKAGGKIDVVPITWRHGDDRITKTDDVGREMQAMVRKLHSTGRTLDEIVFRTKLSKLTVVRLLK